MESFTSSSSVKQETYVFSDIQTIMRMITFVILHRTHNYQTIHLSIVHPGPVVSSSEGWHVPTNKYSFSTQQGRRHLVLVSNPRPSCSKALVPLNHPHYRATNIKIHHEINAGNRYAALILKSALCTIT